METSTDPRNKGTQIKLSRLSLGSFAVLLLCLLAVLTPLCAQAASYTWNNAASGNWDVAGNWIGGVPLVSDTAIINNSGTALVSPGVSGKYHRLRIGVDPGGSGVAYISGGVLSGTTADVGYSAAGTAIISSGTWINTNLAIGNGGSGTMMLNGGVVSAQNSDVGQGGSGIVTVNGGTWSIAEQFVLGANGAGSLTVNGGSISSDETVLGYNSAGSASATVQAGTWTAASRFYVGNRGTGDLQINGGVVSSQTGVIGVEDAGNGTVTVNSGTWINSIQLSVGQSATGALNLTGGAVSNGYGSIGDFAGSKGTATISGGIWNNSQRLLIGHVGTGILNLTDSGVVTVGAGSGTVTITTFASGVGTLNIGTGATAGILNASVVTGGSGAARVNFNHIGTKTFEPRLEGSLLVTKNGAGTTILTGSNSHTGGTVITAGGLQIGNGGTAGSVEGNITNNSHLAFNRSDNVTFSSTISGIGDVTKLGAGTLTLTGSNSYTGGTVVTSGTLQIGNGSTTGSVAGNIENNSDLVFNRSNDLSFNGIISGTGDLTKLGAGILTLTNTNTYLGETFLNAGTLTITSLLDHGDTVFVNSGATLNGSGSIYRNVVVSAGGTLSNSLTIVGQVTLSGTAQQNVGNVSSGTATASAGQQLIVDNATGGDINAAAGTANVSSLDGANLQLGNWGGAVTTLSSGTVATSGGALTVQQGTFAGAITGNGAVIKTGSGTLTVQSENSYSGGTTIQNGTLSLAEGGSLGAAPVDIASNGRFLAQGNVEVANEVVISSATAVYEKAFSDSESLSNIGSFSSNLGGPATTTAIVEGTAGAGGTNVTVQYGPRGPSEYFLISERITLSGLDETTFLMVMDVQIPNGVEAEFLYISWLDPMDDVWKPAVDGNHGEAGGLAGFYADTSYMNFLSLNGGWNAVEMLGAYGVDRENGQVWAVIDHNSEFGAVPEPSTWALIGLGAAALIFTRRKRTAQDTVA